MYQVTITLNSRSTVPLYAQIYRYFADEILTGRLPAGKKLPSKRALCDHLGVSQSTVDGAYGLLLAEGYIEAKPRQGYYAAKVESHVRTETMPYTLLEPPPTPKPRFDFSTGAVDTSLFPYSSWAKLYRETLYSAPELLQSGSRQGEAALRQALAEYLEEFRGVACSPAQIVVGAGVEYLIGLLSCLLPDGTVFGMEDPGYPAAVNTLLEHRRHVQFLPLDDQGLSPEHLDGIDTVFLTPSHQFPMGLTMPISRRAQLLHWANKKEGRYIIEDDYDSEFRYETHPIPAMQGMSRGQRVIYLGTFSHGIAPAIRMAYLVLPAELLERYLTMSGFSHSTVSRYEQSMMARFIREGLYARYLRRVGKLYRGRREKLLSALSGIEGAEISGSNGGLHFLLTNLRHSEAELCRRAEEAGIVLQGLSRYCRETEPKPSTVIIGYGGLANDDIDEAVRILKQAWQ